MKITNQESSHGRKAAQFRRTVRAILVVLERLAAHAGVESNELDELVVEFFNRPDTGGSVDSEPEDIT